VHRSQQRHLAQTDQPQSLLAKRHQSNAGRSTRVNRQRLHNPRPVNGLPSLGLRNARFTNPDALGARSMTRVPVGDQPADIEKQIRDMILEYISKPTGNCLFCCCCCLFVCLFVLLCVLCCCSYYSGCYRRQHRSSQL
jgi:hypothetical protein